MTLRRGRAPGLWAALLLAVMLTSGLGATAQAAVQPLAEAQVLVGPDGAPPPDDAPWQRVALPDDAALSRPGHQDAAAWYRMAFDGPPAATGPDEPWVVYLPYFYYGGGVWLNGQLLTRLPVSDARRHAWSYRPRLLALPAPLLQPGRNELTVWAAQPDKYPMRFAQPRVGPLAELQPVYDRRLFWTRVIPQFTVTGSLLVAAFVLFIWWRRRSEVLYGLFGIAAALWGVRSLTFVLDVMPIAQWHWWRVLYQCATGIFVIAMALFTLRLAGVHRPRVEWALVAYGLVGPLWFALQGFSADLLVARWWMAGMIPVGIGIIAVAFWSVGRQRTLGSAILPVAMAFAVLVGIHDYLLVWNPALLARWLPEWTRQRMFLMHYGSNTMLLAMGGVLTVRFIQSLTSLEDLNRTLETRVADRERALADNYARLSALEREHAASEERQLIMRDLHDGLGSQLFTSLSRVERGDMDNGQIASALRTCIADMRLALDALASEEHDLGAALGNFMFRWEQQLLAAGVRPGWVIELPDDGSATLTPHAALQLLRVAQEALTNVLKHAQATRVEVRLRRRGEMLELEVQDNGRGLAGASQGGHGVASMRSRAQRLGAQFELHAGSDGTCVLLRLPIGAAVSA